MELLLTCEATIHGFVWCINYPFSIFVFLWHIINLGSGVWCRKEKMNCKQLIKKDTKHLNRVAWNGECKVITHKWGKRLIYQGKKKRFNHQLKSSKWEPTKNICCDLSCSPPPPSLEAHHTTVDPDSNTSWHKQEELTHTAVSLHSCLPVVALSFWRFFFSTFNVSYHPVNRHHLTVTDLLSFRPCFNLF